jgi:hypothetical protein
VDGTDITSDGVVSDTLRGIGGEGTRRVRASEQMHIAIVCMRGRCEQAGLPKAKVSRYGVRPGT